jgi:CYTH domain-containing protein
VGPGRYAKLEDEQRFVVACVPDGATSPRRIDDRYLRGTRLRLRRVHDHTGTTYKLGHKVRPDPAHPSVVWHTTSYLDEAEYSLLKTLGADSLEKRRWSLASGCADEFLGQLEGLVLVEGDRPLTVPDGGVEVTDDERFCGCALAGLDEVGARALLEHARSLVT